ncbi:LPS assembly lipoprotein LptE [Plastorhodobacter daqingensis]|uniref:LPS assembly lipoprotein LptE n=1 Tax=Plastorhodobacter daqingensis TaxID=1387281 RepID=A0ABW2UFZ5_9RHOB
MSWSDRRHLLRVLVPGLLAASLSGCGFQPMLAPGSPGAALSGRVLVDAPTDRAAFDLVDRLEQRLGRAETPAYRLSYSINLREQGLGVTPEGATTRYNLDGSITYALREIGGDAIVASGRVESFTSWSATGSTLSTLGAEEDARQRLMQILADQIVTRLLAAAP